MSNFKELKMKQSFSGDEITLNIGSTQICKISHDRGNGVGYEEAVEIACEIEKRWNGSEKNSSNTQMLREIYANKR